VQINKLTPEIAAELILKYYNNNTIVLNSDNGFRKCNITSVAKTIDHLRLQGAERSLIKDLSNKNAEMIFRL
jgi:predicted metal-dependent TIM-barrel fold hydrolase